MFKLTPIFIFLTLFTTQCSKSKVNMTDSIINTQHLEDLYQEINIDDTKMGGIWIYSNAPDYQVLTDEDEGFTCVDDVSRTLIFYCRQFNNTQKNEDLEKIKMLSKFILHMQSYNGYYYNFMFPDNQINTTHQNSKPTPNFWSWRAFWALSELCLVDESELVDIQIEAKEQLSKLNNKIETLFKNPYGLIEVEGLTMPNWMELYGSDQISVIVLGLCNYYEITNDQNIKSLIQVLGESILKVQYGDENTFPYGSFLSWKNIWHAWGSRQSYALLKAGELCNNETFISQALFEINNFHKYCNENNYFSEFSISKSGDSLITLSQKKYPQIAYGISPMILASMEAYNITKEEKYAEWAGKLSLWFTGSNAANQAMYNSLNGIVYDGIDSESQINFNSGAESTIEALLSLQAIATSDTAVKIFKGGK